MNTAEHLDSQAPALTALASSSMLSDTSLQARAINILNVFRFLLSLFFVSLKFFIDQPNWLFSESSDFFFQLSATYLAFSVVLLALNHVKPKLVLRFLPAEVVTDIGFTILLMHAAGGIQNGLGLLLIITIVSASLVSQGRLALFYAAIASIGLLLEQSYQITVWDTSPLTYTQPVMLSISCFATAWLAYSLAKRMNLSEALASARGIDLENLAQVNALITQEMHDGVLVVDQHLHVRHHNAQAAHLLAHKGNMMALHLTAIAPQVAEACNAWLKKEEGAAMVTLNHRELRLRLMPIRPFTAHEGADNPPAEPHYFGAVIFIQDWSQLQATAQQAKLAALGRLTVNIAHEIRNPLSAISHANQLLQEDEALTAPTSRMLQIVADNIQRIDQIIRDVLELNRRDRTHQEAIDLPAFLLDFHHQFCAVEKIPITHFMCEVPPFSEGSIQQHKIYFDQRHLTQILWNLSKNAWQHCQKQVGSLQLRCVVVRENLIDVEVIDDGIGIADQDKPKLFEPFFTTKHTGSGLGLYISRELAEANSAVLAYHALAQGSAFVLHLKKSF